MKKTKRVLALMLAASMSLGLAACGGGGDTTQSPTGGNNSTPSGGASGDTVELTLWTYPVGTFADNLDATIEAFNKVHPEISITYETIDYQNGDTKVTSAIQGGTTPDLIFEGPERLVGNWGRSNVMVDLSDLWAEDAASDIADGVKNASQLDGKYYMYPLSVTAHSMAINYEVFEAAGALQYIDEETRTWTTDNFVKALEAVKTAIDNGTVNVITPGIVYCGGQGGDQGTRALVNNLYSGYFTNEDGTAYTADSEQNVKALELLQTLVSEGKLDGNTAFVASDELQAFANQTCAMTFCWNYSNYVSYAEQTQFTPYVMAFPSDDGVPELEMGIYGLGIFDNGDQAKIDAAKEFIRFVCNDQTQATECIKQTGFFPVHENFGDVYAGTDEEETKAPFALMSTYTGRFYNLTPGWTEQRTNWWNMLQKIFGGTDVKTAVDEYVSASNANIK